ncbi:MAG: hypothetical protein DRK00_10230 [Thermoprotei archaeon]|nr:MAG: hypothetical protein DRK00_10230 [Thermoprotei archaeon]
MSQEALNELKKRIFKLLESDPEFRYAIAAYLGLDRIITAQNETLQEIRKLWEEVRSLREGQAKVWAEIRKLWEEVRALREGQNKLWEEVRELRRSHERLWRYVRAGFRSIQRALGASFEDYARSFIELMLSEMGYPEAEVGRRVFIRDGELVEVNIFCEEPLVVGEATTSIETVEEAEREVEKLIERVKLIQEKLGRRPLLTVLAVANAPHHVAEALKRMAREHGFKLALGREIKEVL